MDSKQLAVELGAKLKQAVAAGQIDMSDDRAVRSFVASHVARARGIQPTVYRSVSGLAKAWDEHYADSGIDLDAIERDRVSRSGVGPLANITAGSEPPVGFDFLDQLYSNDARARQGQAPITPTPEQRTKTTMRPPTLREARVLGLLQDPNEAASREVARYSEQHPYRAAIGLGAKKGLEAGTFGLSDWALRKLTGATGEELAAMDAAMAEGSQRGGGWKATVAGAIPHVAGYVNPFKAAGAVVSGGLKALGKIDARLAARGLDDLSKAGAAAERAAIIERAATAGNPGRMIGDELRRRAIPSLGRRTAENVLAFGSERIITPEVKEATGGLPAETEGSLLRRTAEGVTTGLANVAGSALTRFLPGAPKALTRIGGGAVIQGGQSAAFADEGQRGRAFLEGLVLGGAFEGLDYRSERRSLGQIKGIEDAIDRMARERTPKALPGPGDGTGFQHPPEAAAQRERLVRAMEDLPQGPEHDAIRRDLADRIQKIDEAVFGPEADVPGGEFVPGTPDKNAAPVEGREVGQWGGPSEAIYSEPGAPVRGRRRGKAKAPVTAEATDAPLFEQPATAEVAKAGGREEIPISTPAPAVESTRVSVDPPKETPSAGKFSGERSLLDELQAMPNLEAFANDADAIRAFSSSSFWNEKTVRVAAKRIIKARGEAAKARSDAAGGASPTAKTDPTQAPRRPSADPAPTVEEQPVVDANPDETLEQTRARLRGMTGLSPEAFPPGAIADSIVGESARDAGLKAVRGITDPGGSLKQLYDDLDARNERMAETMGRFAEKFPRLAKWLPSAKHFSFGPRNSQLRQILRDFFTEELTANSLSTEMRVASRSLTPEKSRDVWYRFEKGEDPGDAAIRKVQREHYELAADVRKKIGDTIEDPVEREGWMKATERFYKPGGPRFVRRTAGEKLLERKRAARKQSAKAAKATGIDPNDVDGLESIAAGVDGLVESMTSKRKYETPEEAEAAGFVADHRAIIQSIEHLKSVQRVLGLMERVKREMPGMWKDPPKKGAVPVEGSDWRLADGKGWGVLNGKWIHKDIHDNLLPVARPRQSGLTRLLVNLNAKFGLGKVVSNPGTIIKSMGIEGIFINYRHGIGVASQMRFMRDFVRELQAMEDGEAPSEAIQMLMNAGLWELEGSAINNLVDEDGPALTFDDVGGRGFGHAKQSWRRFLNVLSEEMAKADLQTKEAMGHGGTAYRANAVVNAVHELGYGINFARLLGAQVDNVSGAGLKKMARFLDQMHRYSLLRGLTEEGGSAIQHKLYKAISGKKQLSVADKMTALRAVKDSYDMRSVPRIINTIADAPIIGMRFLRPAYLMIHNAVVRGHMLRNPLGYGAAIGVAAIGNAVFRAANPDIDDDEIESSRLTAAEAYGKNPEDLIPVMADDEGGISWMDWSFFSLGGAIDSAIPGGQGFVKSGSAVTDFGRSLLASNPFGSTIALGTGYDVYRNELGRDVSDLALEVASPFVPVSGVNSIIQRARANAERKRKGRSPRFSKLDQASRAALAMPIIYVGGEGTKIRREQDADAYKRSQLAEYGSRQVTVPDVPARARPVAPRGIRGIPGIGGGPRGP